MESCDTSKNVAGSEKEDTERKCLPPFHPQAFTFSSSDSEYETTSESEKDTEIDSRRRIKLAPTGEQHVEKSPTNRQFVGINPAAGKPGNFSQDLKEASSDFAGEQWHAKNRITHASETSALEKARKLRNSTLKLSQLRKRRRTKSHTFHNPDSLSSEDSCEQVSDNSDCGHNKKKPRSLPPEWTVQNASQLGRARWGVKLKNNQLKVFDNAKSMAKFLGCTRQHLYDVCGRRVKKSIYEIYRLKRRPRYCQSDGIPVLYVD